MKIFYYFLVFLFLISELTFSQNAIVSEPETIEISETELPEIDQIIQKNIEKGFIPGGVFLIAHEGRIIYYKSFGIDDRSNLKPYKKDDIFRIASMTKAITSTAVMQLYEQGKLDLDDPVYKYIPAFKNTLVLDKFNKEDSTYTTNETDKPITINHLLTHTSGIYYGQFDKGKYKAIYQKKGLNRLGLTDTILTTEEMVNKIARAPLAFQPGTEWKYGLNLDVLGRVIEVVSKQSLAAYFKENIFDPLEMNDTYFYLPKDKQDRLVKLHTPNDREVTILKPDPDLNYPKYKDPNHYAGGGGLSSTALDYAKFCMAMLNDGEFNGNRILSEHSVLLMRSDHISDLKQNGKGFSKIKGMGFGLGFGIITEERPVLWPYSEDTYFWGGVFNTKYFIDPEKDLIFVGMTQIYPFKHKKFWHQLNREIYRSIEEMDMKTFAHK